MAMLSSIQTTYKKFDVVSSNQRHIQKKTHLEIHWRATVKWTQNSRQVYDSRVNTTTGRSPLAHYYQMKRRLLKM
jgi:hypothetical protein